MTSPARRRFALAAIAIGAYAACADQPPEPYVGTHERERLDYDTPAYTAPLVCRDPQCVREGDCMGHLTRPS